MTEEEIVARAIWLEETMEGWTDDPDERMSTASGRLIRPEGFMPAARAAITALDKHREEQEAWDRGRRIMARTRYE